MIDDLEPLRPVGVIDPGDLHQLLIFEARRVAQLAQDLDDAVAAARPA